MKATYIAIMSVCVSVIFVSFYYDLLAFCIALMVGTLLGNGFALAYLVGHDEK